MVRHELEPGDVIEAVSTVARIAGVDSSRQCILYEMINHIETICSWPTHLRPYPYLHVGWSRGK
jgi:hypothetical protein